MKIKKFYKFMLFTIISISFTTFSCAKKMQSQTITTLSESDRVRIKNVAILVETDQKLDVNQSKTDNRFWVAMLRNPPTCTGISCIFVPFLIVATAIIEESVRSGMNHSKENEFRRDSSEIHFTKSLSANIDNLLKSSNYGYSAVIVEYADPEQLVQNGYDSLLHLELNKIQLNKCPRQVVKEYVNPDEALNGIGPVGSNSSCNDTISKWKTIYSIYHQKQQMDAVHKYLSAPDTIINSKKEVEKNKQLKKEINAIKPCTYRYSSINQPRICIHYNAKITSLSDNKLLWEKEKLYYDSECELVKDMQYNSDAVADMFSRSLIDIAKKIINEINYDTK